jgi:hypothetical protein
MNAKKILFLCSVAVLAGCSKTDTVSTTQAPRNQTTASAEQPGPTPDPCALLTTEETQAILGEAIKDVRRQEKIEGILAVSQCVFEMPTPANSIVLTLTQKSSAPEARNPREVWAESFAAPIDPSLPKGRESVEPPTRVEKLGDEAFWTGEAKTGSLYVLKGNSYFRIKVGGREDLEGKIAKCRALAEKVLAREF